MHFSRSPFMAFAVTAIIGRFLPCGSLRISFIVAMPSISGIMMSISTTSMPRVVGHAVDRLAAVVGPHDVHAVLFQHGGQREDVAHVVVDDQHALAGQRLGRLVDVVDHAALELRQARQAAVQRDQRRRRTASGAPCTSCTVSPSSECQAWRAPSPRRGTGSAAAGRCLACAAIARRKSRGSHVAEAVLQHHGSRTGCRPAPAAAAAAWRRRSRRSARPRSAPAGRCAPRGRPAPPAGSSRGATRRRAASRACASSTSLERIGFSTKASAPDLNARSLLSSVEITHTGTWRSARSCLMRSSTRQPAMSGRCMSSVTAEGLCWLASVSAPAPIVVTRPLKPLARAASSRKRAKARSFSTISSTWSPPWMLSRSSLATLSAASCLGADQGVHGVLRPRPAGGRRAGCAGCGRPLGHAARWSRRRGSRSTRGALRAWPCRPAAGTA